jgi:hypothetical protein
MRNLDIKYSDKELFKTSARWLIFNRPYDETREQYFARYNCLVGVGEAYKFTSEQFQIITKQIASLEKYTPDVKLEVKPEVKQEVKPTVTHLVSEVKKTPRVYKEIQLTPKPMNLKRDNMLAPKIIATLDWIIERCGYDISNSDTLFKLYSATYDKVKLTHGEFISLRSNTTNWYRSNSEILALMWIVANPPQDEPDYYEAYKNSIKKDAVDIRKFVTFLIHLGYSFTLD